VIAVLDYGIGNLRSAEKALLRVGADARLVDSPEGAIDASGVVLPGVGAFGACARALRFSGLDEAVRLCIADGRPFLGICVGLQLLFEGSEEDPGVPGLAILEGSVRALRTSERVPQMQWNLVRQPSGTSSRLLGDAASRWYYFVHSYVPVPEGDEALSTVVGTCDYGGEIAVAFERGNMFGTQFHPEKSATAGLELLARFASICRESPSEH
jgi:glutamine amidotransferase